MRASSTESRHFLSSFWSRFSLIFRISFDSFSICDFISSLPSSLFLRASFSSSHSFFKTSVWSLKDFTSFWSSLMVASKEIFMFLFSSFKPLTSVLRAFICSSFNFNEIFKSSISLFFLSFWSFKSLTSLFKSVISLSNDTVAVSLSFDSNKICKSFVSLLFSSFWSFTSLHSSSKFCEFVSKLFFTV